MELVLIIVIVIEILLLLISVLGNLLIIIVMFKEKMFQETPANRYMISIAIVDLITGSFAGSYSLSLVRCEVTINNYYLKRLIMLDAVKNSGPYMRLLPLDDVSCINLLYCFNQLARCLVSRQILGRLSPNLISQAKSVGSSEMDYFHLCNNRNYIWNSTGLRLE